MESDEQLYHRARQGSIGAFRELYARYEAPLYGYLRTRLGRREDAEEVFHDAMLAILEGAEACFEPGGFRPWLYQVATRGALNHCRSRTRRESHERALAVEPTPLHGPAPLLGDGLAWLVAEEEAKALSRAVDRLARPLADVYALRRAGASYEDMARTLAVPVGTIKSRLHQLIRHLRKEISRWHVR